MGRILSGLGSWLAGIWHAFWGAGSCEKSVHGNTYELLEVPLDDIASNPYQARRQMDQEALEELSKSLEQHGIINPVLVTRVDGDETYQLIAGERRVRASKLAGYDSILALVRDFNQQEMIEVCFLENIQREPLNAVDEAKMYKRLRTEFRNLSVDELADLIGKSPEAITRLDWVLDLPSFTQQALSRGLISAETAQKMTPLDEPRQKEVLSIINEEDTEPAEVHMKIYQLRNEQEEGEDRSGDEPSPTDFDLPPELGERNR